MKRRAAIALLVTAGVLWAEESEFGWFAYEPLSDQTVPNVLVLTGRSTSALIIGADGLLFLGFAAGIAVARGTRRHDP